MAALKIRLLGGFEALNASGEPLALSGRKARALLAFLAMTPGEPQPREKLVALLWGDRAEEQARGSLRQALAELRRALDGMEPAPLVADRHSVSLDSRAVEVDVAEFEAAIAEGGPDLLARTVGLYRGDLLDGFAAAEPAFEDWLRDERARLGGLAGDAISRLLDHQASTGNTDAAITTARRLLALDPLREAVHRALIGLYAEKGDRAAAVRQYQACRDVLRDELGLEPEAETERLAAKVRSGAVAAGEVDEPAATGEPSTADPLPLPDKPSIAVLPFVNISGDPEQEYFADGITEDIITELSRFRLLFVIARNSSFHYKGRSPNVKEIGGELGVQYVVEGSVRKAGSRLRISAQLVEAETGNHLWAERYDRELEDVFAVQDEVVQAIVAAIPARIDEAAVRRARYKPTENLTAYDCLLRGEWYMRSDFAHRDAIAMFAKAIEIDPHCARAHVRLATYHGASIFNHGAPAEEAERKARSYAEQALAIDDGDSLVQGIAAEVYLICGEHDLARRHIERAIALNPNDAHVARYAGLVDAYLGNHSDALRWMRTGMRLDPHVPDSSREGLFDAYYMARDYEQAVRVAREWPNPPHHIYAVLAAVYAQLGRMDEARDAVATYRRERPETSEFASLLAAHLKMCARQEDADHWLEGYRKAGLDV